MSKKNNSKNNINKEEKHMITLKRHCTPDVSLKKSLKQMKLMRKSKLPETTWEQLKKELQDDKKDQED